VAQAHLSRRFTLKRLTYVLYFLGSGPVLTFSLSI
jgi:hypothetical protein